LFTDRAEVHASAVNQDNPHTEARWAGLNEVMRMSGPIILGSLSYTIMLFVDQVMVARLGTDALAALGSAGLWSYISGCFFLGIIGCVSTFVAQSYGRGNLDNCARYAWQGIYISFLAGVMALVLWPLSGPLFAVMRHPEGVMQLEIVYFRIRLFGFVSMAWTTALASFFQAVGRSRVPMYVAIVCNAANILLNYLLIFGKFGFPRWEIAGAGTATVISLALQVVLLQAVFLSGPIDRRFGSRRAYVFDLAKCRELIRIGLPAGLTFLMDIANWGLFTSFIVGYFGAVALASHNAAIGFMHLAFMPAIGLNQGLAAIVGQYLGRKDPTTAAARTYTAMKLAMAYMFVMGLIFAVFGRVLIDFFFTDDPEVLDLGHKLLILAALFQAFDGINIVASGALRGAGDTRWMAIMTFLFAYFFFLPLALALAFPAGLGAVGAWIAATVYIIGLSGLLFTRFRGGRWQRIRIFAEDLAPGRVEPGG